MDKVFIYGLYSSDDDNIRYVGKCKDKKYRLKMHYSQRNSSSTYKNNWIKSVLRRGCEIKMLILEEVDFDKWESKEIYWINKFKNLTNTSSGGKGGSGKKYNISYNEAKKLLNECNVKSKSEWFEFTKSKDWIESIPKSPRQYFKESWISWGDFLGTNRTQDNKIADIYVSYNESKNWIKKNLKINSISEWKKAVAENLIPNFIPNRPNRFYKNRGWYSWVDFLSKRRISNRKRNIIPYKEAKYIINNLNISSIKEYKKIQSGEYINDLPVHPHLTYKNKGFISYEEFFKRL